MSIRLLRGIVVVREDYKSDTAHYTHIIVPDVSTEHDRKAVARARKWHRGKVLAMGAPAMTSKGAEVPHGFAVGDEVLFHWVNYEEGFTRPWEDGELACWIPQNAVDAVLEPEGSVLVVPLAPLEPKAHPSADFGA